MKHLSQRLVLAITLMLPSACGPASAPSPAAGVLATPPARAALGRAADYPAAPLSSDALAAAKASHAARRQLAWSVVARTLAPVETPSGPLPRWATWYGGDDFQALFRKLYESLGRDGRQARAPLTAAAIDLALLWQETMLLSLPGWNEERWNAWRARLGSAEAVRGLTGLSRTLYSPGAMRHLLTEYARIDGCLDRVDATDPTAPPREADNFTLCFGAELPSDAVVVKTAWRRQGAGFTMPAFRTDAAALQARFAAPAVGWGVADAQLDPPPDAAYGLELAPSPGSDQGNAYRLAGLHIMSKEAREWLWITLWWSDSPDSDFGADRPAAITALGPPWSNYKMCAVVAFDDEAPVDAAEPSLAAALRVAQAATAPRSWCSNPYLEDGAHNHTTNCIGCHQHGGMGTLVDPALPRARARARGNFPADYLWSIRQEPESLGRAIRNRIRYHDIYDRMPIP
jgi:hypothetical protein